MANFLDSLLCPTLVKPSRPTPPPNILACSGFLVKPRYVKQNQVVLEMASWVGVARDLEIGQVVSTQWGVRPTKSSPTALRAGNLIGMAVAFDDFTAGSVSLNALIDGIAQNGVGQTFTATSQVSTFEFPTPITISSNNTIDVCVEVLAGFAPVGTNVTVTLYYTQTGFTVPTP